MQLNLHVIALKHEILTIKSEIYSISHDVIIIKLLSKIGNSSFFFTNIKNITRENTFWFCF